MYKLGLVPRRCHGVVHSASFKLKSIVTGTVKRCNTEGLVVTVKNDKADSNNFKVMSTLKFEFAGPTTVEKGSVPSFVDNVARISSDSVSDLYPRLHRATVRMTYSIHGPLLNPGKTMSICSKRGNTHPTSGPVLRTTVRG